MESIRTIGKYKLNIGTLMANGLFNVTDDELMESTTDKGVSYWFDNDFKEELMEMGDEEFVEECKELVGDNRLRF